MKVVVHLHERETQRTVTFTDDSWDSADLDSGHVEYMYSEGNYACDCNRRLFFYRFGFDEEPDQVWCGDQGYLATVEVDDQVVIDEIGMYP